MHAERRRSARVSACFPVLVQIDSTRSDSWLAFVRDSSVGGLLLSSAHVLPLNVPLIIHFPRENGQGFAIARVVRQNGDLFACEFIHRQYYNSLLAAEKAIVVSLAPGEGVTMCEAADLHQGARH